jgi:hypothetical protein
VTPAPAIRALGAAEPAGAGDGPLESLGPRQRPGDRYRRARRECLLGIEAVERALEAAGAGRDAVAGPRTGLAYVTAAAYGPSNQAFLAGTGGIHFPYTAPAAVPAEVAIEFGVTGPYGILIGGPPAALAALWQAARWLADGEADRVLVLAVEVFEECAALYRRARRLTGRPLVETAVCAWLEPGTGEMRLRWEPAPRAPARPARWAGEPLVALARWWAAGAGDAVALDGAWRGRRARLTWTEPARAAAGGARR